MQGKEGNTLYNLCSFYFQKNQQESSILRKVQGKLKGLDKSKFTHNCNRNNTQQDLDANKIV